LGSEMIKVRTLPTVKPSIGETAYVSFDMKRISIFDKETESSII
jgi:hypothetical protein